MKEILQIVGTILGLLVVAYLVLAIVGALLGAIWMRGKKDSEYSFDDWPGNTSYQRKVKHPLKSTFFLLAGMGLSVVTVYLFGKYLQIADPESGFLPYVFFLFIVVGTPAFLAIECFKRAFDPVRGGNSNIDKLFEKKKKDPKHIQVLNFDNIKPTPQINEHKGNDTAMPKYSPSVQIEIDTKVLNNDSLPESKCLYCKKKFIPWRKNQKFCTSSCRQKYYQKSK